MRVRWQVAAKAVGVVLAGALALAVLPGLLRAPEPAPPAKDVGLPRVTNGAFVRQGRTKAPFQPRHRPERSQPARGHAAAPEPPAAADAATPEPTPAPEPAVLPSPDPVAPAPPPAPPPPPPGDGSAEFAPR